MSRYMQPHCFNLTAPQGDLLRRLAATTGTPQAELLRRMIDRCSVAQALNDLCPAYSGQLTAR